MHGIHSNKATCVWHIKGDALRTYCRFPRVAVKAFHLMCGGYERFLPMHLHVDQSHSAPSHILVCIWPQPCQELRMHTGLLPSLHNLQQCLPQSGADLKSYLPLLSIDLQHCRQRSVSASKATPTAASASACPWWQLINIIIPALLIRQGVALERKLTIANHMEYSLVLLEFCYLPLGKCVPCCGFWAETATLRFLEAGQLGVVMSSQQSLASCIYALCWDLYRLINIHTGIML